MTYHKFDFRAVSKVSKKKKNLTEYKDARLSDSRVESYQAVLPTHNVENFNFSIWFSKLKLEYLTVTKGKTFIILLLVTVLFSLGNLIGSIFDGPINNGQPYYPLTSLILELLRQPLTDIGMLVAIPHYLSL